MASYVVQEVDASSSAADVEKSLSEVTAMKVMDCLFASGAAAPTVLVGVCRNTNVTCTPRNITYNVSRNSKRKGGLMRRRCSWPARRSVCQKPV